MAVDSSAPAASPAAPSPPTMDALPQMTPPPREPSSASSTATPPPAPSAAPAGAAAAAASTSSSASASASSSALAGAGAGVPAPPPAPAPGAAQVNKGRCWTCQKKVGLTGFECRCAFVFCGKHRYSDQHNCDFDYKAEQKKLLAAANPVVKGDKVEKL